MLTELYTIATALERQGLLRPLLHPTIVPAGSGLTIRVVLGDKITASVAPDELNLWKYLPVSSWSFPVLNCNGGFRDSLPPGVSDQVVLDDKGNENRKETSRLRTLNQIRQIWPELEEQFTESITAQLDRKFHSKIHPEYLAGSPQPLKDISAATEAAGFKEIAHVVVAALAKSLDTFNNYQLKLLTTYILGPGKLALALTTPKHLGYTQTVKGMTTASQHVDALTAAGNPEEITDLLGNRGPIVPMVQVAWGALQPAPCSLISRAKSKRYLARQNGHAIPVLSRPSAEKIRQAHAYLMQEDENARKKFCRNITLDGNPSLLIMAAPSSENWLNTILAREEVYFEDRENVRVRQSMWEEVCAKIAAGQINTDETLYLLFITKVGRSNIRAQELKVMTGNELYTALNAYHTEATPLEPLITKAVPVLPGPYAIRQLVPGIHLDPAIMWGSLPADKAGLIARRLLESHFQTCLRYVTTWYHPEFKQSYEDRTAVEQIYYFCHWIARHMKTTNPVNMSHPSYALGHLFGQFNALHTLWARLRKSSSQSLVGEKWIGLARTNPVKALGFAEAQITPALNAAQALQRDLAARARYVEQAPTKLELDFLSLAKLVREQIALVHLPEAKVTVHDEHQIMLTLGYLAHPWPERAKSTEPDPASESSYTENTATAEPVLTH